MISLKFGKHRTGELTLNHITLIINLNLFFWFWNSFYMVQRGSQPPSNRSPTPFQIFVSPTFYYSNLYKVLPPYSMSSNTPTSPIHTSCWRYLFPATNHSHLNPDETSQTSTVVRRIGTLMQILIKTRI